MNSDLGVRTLSAIVMLAVAGGALWLGGWVWTIFAALVAAGVLWEWRCLVRGLAAATGVLVGWNVAGILYIGLAVATLIVLREGRDGFLNVLVIVAMVIATDVGAYFAGRSIGGPKIAPAISPSKTWAGLCGGMIGASLICFVVFQAWYAGWCEVYYGVGKTDLPEGVFAFDDRCHAGLGPLGYAFASILIAGTLVATIAQAGDFFESWMKRKAGVKDSGNLIPGHGGLFDRLDGLLGVTFVIGLLMLLQAAAS